MIVLRQKIFVAPLIAMGARALPYLGKALNVAGTVGTGVMIKQGIDQQKQQEEFAKQQEEQNRRMTKALNRIAEQASSNPQTAQAAYNVMNQAEDRQFSILSTIGKHATSIGKNTLGLGRNIGKIALENKNILIGSTMAGTAMGGASYVTDKVIQRDMKKNGIPLMQNTEYPVYDDYENYFPEEQKNYSSVLKGVKSIGKTIFNAGKENKGTILLTSTMGSVPLATSYLSTKDAIKDQINAEKLYQQEKSYSIIPRILGIGKSVGKSISSGINTFKNNPVGSTLGGISNFIGGGGKKGVQNFGKRLKELGEESGNSYSKNIGRFIQRDPNTAVALSIPVGVGITAGTWDLGERATSGIIRSIDKDAYKYQDSLYQEA